MVAKLSELRAATDDQLLAEHDRLAPNTVAGTNYIVNELNRRDQARAVQSSQRLARAALWLAGANALLAVAAVAIAVFS